MLFPFLIILSVCLIRLCQSLEANDIYDMNCISYAELLSHDALNAQGAFGKTDLSQRGGITKDQSLSLQQR